MSHRPGQRETNGQRDSSYRRGAIMGLTMAEAFILISFALLLLFALWQWETNKENTEPVEAFKEFSPQQQQAALKVIYRLRDLDQQQIERVYDAVDDGVFQDPENSWRFISDTELQRLLDGAQKLPKDVHRQLADLVEAQQAEQVLSELGVLERIIEAGQSLSGITDKIGHLQDQEAELAQSLRNEIGNIVANLNGEIGNDGSITLPESVVFRQGSPDVSQQLREFLRAACEPWLRVLKTSKVQISEVRIEGHASSEWRSGSSEDQAYLGNLDLSQRRSQNVLLACLTYISDEEIKGWARSHLVAVGHSSARPLLDAQGEEDPEKSRRVVFRASPNREIVLRDIEREAQEALSQISYRRELFGGWTDPDGDCVDTRHEILEVRSKIPTVLSADSCRVVNGRWLDPYSGVVLSRASSVEIDHLVPLAWAWDRGASTWTDAEREAFARDRENLVVTESTLNRMKSDSGPIEWLPPNEAFRCEYLERFIEVAERYELGMSTAERQEIDNMRNAVCN